MDEVGDRRDQLGRGRGGDPLGGGQAIEGVERRRQLQLIHRDMHLPEGPETDRRRHLMVVEGISAPTVTRITARLRDDGILG